MEGRKDGGAVVKVNDGRWMGCGKMLFVFKKAGNIKGKDGERKGAGGGLRKSAGRESCLTSTRVYVARILINR